MKTIVNGDELEIDSGMVVSKLLAEFKYKRPDIVSEALNGKVQAREVLDTTVLNENDQVEFVYFMGGGSNALTRDAVGPGGNPGYGYESA